jgi:hypothetical protein
MYRIILCSFALLSLTACALGVLPREALTPALPTAAELTAIPPMMATLTPRLSGATQATPTPAPKPTSVSEPTQIIFSPGVTSVTIEGVLVFCYDIDSYRVQAMEGQTMQVTITLPDDDVIVTVTRQLPDGTWEPLTRSHFLETSVEIPLPATDDYDIHVMRKTAIAGDCEETEPTSVNYTLVIKIPPLLSKDLTLETLKNAEYQLPGEGSFRLENGIHYLPAESHDTPRESWAIVLVEPVAFGDINGDGVDDGVVILNVRYGGTGSFKHIAVVVNRDGQPRNVATVSLGDRTVINAIDILPSGEIHVDAIVHGPKDPLCCPTQSRTWRFQLVGEELVDLDSD